MKEAILKRLNQVAAGLDISPESVRLEYPENAEHGDFSTNMAMAAAKKAGLAPRSLAEKIVGSFSEKLPNGVASLDIAGPGFINFRVDEKFFTEEIVKIADGGAEYGWGTAHAGKKVMVEYTDPNPFKEIHIGHLMSNAIGEAVSRLIQSQGADVIRANWQGDVGPHVAKAIWGAMHTTAKMSDFASKSAFWGKAYAEGAKAYADDPAAKTDIDHINKMVYDRSDPGVNAIYDQGRKDCLDAFDQIYARLGTKFDNYFFEGTEGRNGEAVVREFQKKGIFEESEGAIVFKGEQYGLHTRVFITSHGLPTYETKEIGLNIEKFKLYPDLDQSIIVTAAEQSDYFKVLLKVFELIRPEIAEKTRHMSHGMMRFKSGKMSSRTGNVVSAESLIGEIKKLVAEKIADRGFDAALADEISDQIAIGAIKYSILRSSPGSDIIFDSAASISFEGDSGPYLQYSAVRARSIIEKSITNDQKSKIKMPEKVGLLERLISRFPDLVLRARTEYAPQIIAGYLIELAGAFNSFYASQTILDENDPLSVYRVAVTQAFLTTMTNGLWLLGIKVPKKM